MRCAVAGWFVFASALLAQSTEVKTAVVRVPSAEVRGGKSSIFPVTGYLRQGQPVQVVRDEGDYLAIAPPSGSSSWVMDRGLTYYPATSGKRAYAVVKLDELPVELGSPDARLPHAVETTKLKRGTIVFPVGEKIVHERAEWWRIEPVATEVRYVAREAVTPPTDASTVVAASPGNAANVSRGPHPLWTQAEEAERFGNCARAEMLYRQLAGEMSKPGGDHDLAMRAFARVDALSRKTQPTTWPARQTAPAQFATNSRNPPPASVPGINSRAIVSGPGWLRRTGVVIDGRTAYALEDNQGQLRYYVLSNGPGLNMELFVNGVVDLTGNLVQRSDLSGGGYLLVDKLHLLRK
ncbi:MAG: hypothetical protein U0746_13585 [Gemmataceae bacterium]